MELRAGQQFAAGPGIATALPDFDFETKSFAGYVLKPDGKLGSLPGFSDQKRGLKAVGVRPYVEHPSFIPLLLAYDLKDGTGPKQWEWGQSFEVLQPLFDHIRAGGLIEAHNVGFEWTVWGWCVEHLGWPPLKLEQLRCSAAKSRANAYPGALADVGKVTGIEHQKDPAGDKLMKLFSIPRNPSQKDPRYFTMPYESPEEWGAYKRYNLRDIEAESEVSLKSPDLSPFELEVWLCDQRVNDRGIQVDIAGVENCIAIVEQAYAKYGAEIRAITGGIEPTELKQLQGWLGANGVSMYGMTEEDVEAALERLRGELAADTRAYRVLELRQMLGSASVKKLYALRASVDKHGRVHDLYMYHAARTGRVIGQGVQPTNLYKGSWNNIEDIEAALKVIAARSLELVEYTYPKLSALDVVNNCLRSLFIAGPGKVLISSDYSAIEGVVAAGLAGCEWRLDVFRTHGMIYEASAAAICNIPFEDFVQHRIATGAEVTRIDGKLVSIKGGKHHPMRNKIGKFAELACGFGGWIGAMIGFGADEFLDEAEMKDAVLGFRAASPEFPEMWGGQSRGRFQDAREELYGLEGCIVNAIKNPGAAYYCRGIGYQTHGDVLYCLLPSGRMLTYHEPRLAPSSRPYANPWELEITYSGWNSNPLAGEMGWVRMKIYGGKAFENVVQAVARDIQAHAVVACERSGYPVVMQTYDELVAEVPVIECLFPEGSHSKSVEKLEAIMMDVPEWARGWPIKAKGGWMGQRYGKFD
jgi:DNA polymerase bacteriophage-type